MGNKYKVRVPWFQSMSITRAALAVYEGVPRDLIDRVMNETRGQRGTPQDQVDWTTPDTWIGERLQGEVAKLAMRFWKESDDLVNPRWLHGPNYLIKIYELARTDASGVCRITEDGHRFIKQDRRFLLELDENEGLIKALDILSTCPQSRLRDLWPEWDPWVRENSKFQADSSIHDALRRRMADLIERGYVSREAGLYSVTDTGLTFLGGVAPGDPFQEFVRSASKYNDSQKRQLLKRLQVMPPYRFEQLVGELLEAMGYEDVHVTKEAGDKGVDVVATIRFGITTVREVVQVKRYQGNINRQVLDQLRGALPYHHALRGTIITTGGFSQGCKDAALFPGAAPIGLIDGSHLLDLLIQNNIGMRERRIALYEVNERYFEDAGEVEDLEASISPPS